MRRHAEVRARGEPRRDVCRGRGGRARGSPRSPRSVRRGRWSSRSRTGGRAIVARFDRRDRPLKPRCSGRAAIRRSVFWRVRKAADPLKGAATEPPSPNPRVFERFVSPGASCHDTCAVVPRARANTPSRDASHATPRAMTRPASAAPKRRRDVASSEEANVKVILRCRCVPPTTRRTPSTSRRFREDDVDACRRRMTRDATTLGTLPDPHSPPTRPPLSPLQSHEPLRGIERRVGGCDDARRPPRVRRHARRPGQAPVDRVYGFDKVFPLQHPGGWRCTTTRSAPSWTRFSTDTTAPSSPTARRARARRTPAEGDHQGCADPPRRFRRRRRDHPHALDGARLRLPERRGRGVHRAMDVSRAVQRGDHGPSESGRALAAGRHALHGGGRRCRCSSSTGVCGFFARGQASAHLAAGSNRRRTAETLCNKQSSRSHSVFTVSVHARADGRRGRGRRPVPANSTSWTSPFENVSKSVPADSRARDRWRVNKSLVTLGASSPRSWIDSRTSVPRLKLTTGVRGGDGKSKTSAPPPCRPRRRLVGRTPSTLEYARRAAS